MNWKIGIDMYTLMCIKLTTNKNLLYKKIKFKKKVLGSRHPSYTLVVEIQTGNSPSSGGRLAILNKST